MTIRRSCAAVIVIPAKAGIQLLRFRMHVRKASWIPAFAGMTSRAS